MSHSGRENLRLSSEGRTSPFGKRTTMVALLPTSDGTIVYYKRGDRGDSIALLGNGTSEPFSLQYRLTGGILETRAFVEMVIEQYTR